MPTLTIEEKLVEAREAYHLLNTGKMARVIVDQNGERVEFTSANRTALYNYIAELEALLISDSKPVSTGPIGFIF
jgi:hypothetical protein